MHVILHENEYILHCACVTRCIKFCFLYDRFFLSLFHSLTTTVLHVVVVSKTILFLGVVCVWTCMHFSTLIRPNTKRPSHQNEHEPIPPQLNNRMQNNELSSMRRLPKANSFLNQMWTCECKERTHTPKSYRRRRKSKLIPKITMCKRFICVNEQT